MNQSLPENNQAGQTDRIVSVNDHGGANNGLAPKLIVVVFIVACIAIGALMTFNRFRAHQRANDQEAVQSAKNARASTGLAGRRTFSAFPPPAKLPVVTASDTATPCEDHLPSRVMTGADGKPLLTPAGQPIRVCQDGKLLLPLLQEAPPAAPATPPAPSTPPPSPSSPPVSRYGGDIVLASGGGPAASPAMPARSLPDAEQIVGGSGAAGLAGAWPGPKLAGGAAEQTPEGIAHPHGGQSRMSRSTPAAAVQASMIGDRDMILPEGRTIDCNLSLRLISEVSGKATCVLSSYVFGDSGVAVLAEPGSVATGDYVAFAAQGQRRLFILWSRLKTTKGVIIELNSPAADALGTSGLDGYVDNRWPERVGAAFLLSTVQDVIGYETARAASGGNGNAATGIAVFQHSTETGNRLAERILESTINIKPTIYKHQGDRATITVARDLDFGSVYALRTK